MLVGIVKTVNTQFCEGFLQDMQLLLLQKRHFKPSGLPYAIQGMSYREEQSRGPTLSQVGSNVFIIQIRITDKRKPQVDEDGLEEKKKHGAAPHFRMNRQCFEIVLHIT